jgi:acyl-CoA synthetase (AMP-forming)/AMP-acid ligase II
MLSHGNLLHNVESCRIVLQTVDLDRFAILLPLFTATCLPSPVAAAAGWRSIVLVKSLHPVRMFSRNSAATGDRHAGYPQFYRSMVNAPIPVPLPLRMCVSGAAPLHVQVLQEFEAKFHIL